MMTSAEGVLLACQPCEGGDSQEDAVLRLAALYGLSPGSKVYCCDPSLMSIGLVERMGARGYGVTGPLSGQTLPSEDVPLPSEEEVVKNFSRGEAQAVYTRDSTVVTVFLDKNQPVYMASNFDHVEPMVRCQRHHQEDKAGGGPSDVLQPNIYSQYSQALGGVSLLDNSVKSLAIASRMRRWSWWWLYTWFLNVSMVQAWRLYRTHIKEQKNHRVSHRNSSAPKVKKERGKKRKRHEEEKEKKRMAKEISLLEFTRQVVELTFQKHGEPDEVIIPQREASARLTPGALEAVRYDSGRHLIILTTITGVCKHCRKRSRYRCDRCQVALHAECFFRFHVQEGEEIVKEEVPVILLRFCFKNSVRINSLSYLWVLDFVVLFFQV